MTSGAGDDETRLGTVELLPGTGRGGRLVRPVLAVAVIVIEEGSGNLPGLVETREESV